MTTPLSALAVVVPAHNEEDLLPRCLHALDEAVDAVRRTRPDLCIRAILVLDRCTDASASIAAGFEHIRPLAVDAGTAGAARAFGVRSALDACAKPLDQTWIACTDADSRVPWEWLVDQVHTAQDGHDLRIGTVEPDPADLDAATLALWWDRHRIADTTEHVFGANLGFRASVYEAIGGFRDLATSEDVDLVARARAAGADVVTSYRQPVLTSGRREGRAAGGFASYLRDLDQHVAGAGDS